MFNEVHALKITRRNNHIDTEAFFFPDAALGNINHLPNKGLILLRSQSDKLEFFESVKGILNPLDNQMLAIVGVRVGMIKAFFEGKDAIPENEEQHAQYSQQLGEDAEYCVVDNTIMEGCKITREELFRAFVSVPEIENYSNRINYVQVESDCFSAQIILDRPTAIKRWNAEIISLDGKYYLPSPQKIRLIFTPGWQKRNEIILATSSGEELQKIISPEYLFPVDAVSFYNACHKYDLPMDSTEIFIVQNARLRNGFIVSSLYYENVEKEKERSLKEFMESL